jgi:LacI family transcriptional regulator
MGLRVPNDLGIIGFDDIPESAFFFPPLSTMRQRIFDLGSRAVRELNRRIEAGRQDDADVRRGAHPEAVWLQTELVVRESSIEQVA